MQKMVVVAGLLCLLFAPNITAQHIVRLNGQTSQTSMSGNSRLNSGQQSVNTNNQDIDLIVEFTGPTLLASGQVTNKGQVGANHKASIELLTTDFIHIAQKNQSEPTRFQIVQSFTSAFNGVHLRAPADAVKDLLRLDYIQNVYVDGIVTTASYGVAYNEKEFDPISATSRGVYTGEGITIAIIDSGIDYSHPDLGGELGEEAKVVGGYDFVNDDADPMDDNGHGTHVAGILAADGALFQGAAPGAKLVAYKVLDHRGIGRDSDVLSAIERAVNPDGDPATNDAVDIINLSLSSLSTGSAEHPVTRAVQNAVEYGVICVVAAGNLGEDGAGSITVPGNAANAITVGASNGFEGVASFSSQGPSGSVNSYFKQHFGIKPDLLAPGVQVRSTWLRGGYRELNGTSMASPYIAGKAAIVLEEYPDWSPERVKAWLVQHTGDLGPSRWIQGAGVFDQTIDHSFVVTPSSMDLGLFYESQSNEEIQVEIAITNLGNEAAAYEIVAGEGWPLGTHVILSTPSILLNPGNTEPVEIMVTVDQLALEALQFPDGYIGHIHVTNEESVVSVPISLFKTQRAHVEIFPPAEAIVYQNEEGETVSKEAPNLSSFFIPPNTYDLLVQFDEGRYTVIRENADVVESAYIEVLKDEAELEVSFEVVDVYHNPLTPVAFEMAIQNQGNELTIMNYVDQVDEQWEAVFFSQISDRFTVDFKVSAFSDLYDYYEIPFFIEGGLDSDVLLENDPVHFKRFVYNYALSDNLDKAYFIPWVRSDSIQVHPGLEELPITVHPGYLLEPPFTKNFYTPLSGFEHSLWKGFGHSVVSASGLSNGKISTQETLLRTSPLLPGSAEVAVGDTGRRRVLQEDQQGRFNLYPGRGGVYWAGELDNSTTRIRIRGPLGGGLFRGEWGEALSEKGDWILFKDEEVIAYDEFQFKPDILPGVNQFFIEKEVQPGSYTLEVKKNVGIEGNNEMTYMAKLSFKTDLADPDPPLIHSIYSQASRTGSDQFVVDVTDVCNWCSAQDARDQVDFVQVWVQPIEESDWIEIEMMKEDSLYVGVYNGAVDMDYYALKVVVADVFGNNVEFIASRGEDSFTPIRVDTEGEERRAKELIVDYLYPNPARNHLTISYELGEPANVNIFVYDVLGRKGLATIMQRPAGVHTDQLDISDLAAGLYVLRVEAGLSVYTRQVMKIK